MNQKDNQTDWARLFRMACALIRQVNADTIVIDHWSFGGGTAMMLQIDHRESHDVDLFLQDPQFLGLLDPQKTDFEFEIRPADYAGDGAGFLKISFQDIGEIDFIVSQPKTPDPTRQMEIEGETVQLETIPEIIAKKIIHRGASLKPRDIFDIAAAAREHREAMTNALRPYKTDVGVALETLARLNPDFVVNAISELQIRPRYMDLVKVALDEAQKILKAI